MVHKGQTVVVVMEVPSIPSCMVRVMRVSDRIDIHCQVVAHLDDLNAEQEAEVKNTLRRIIRRR